MIVLVYTTTAHPYTYWKLDPAYPNPLSPVHRARKFSAVFGTISARNSITIRPASVSFIWISKYTFGLPLRVADNNIRKEREWFEIQVCVESQTNKLSFIEALPAKCPHSFCRLPFRRSCGSIGWWLCAAHREKPTQTTDHRPTMEKWKW
jgi:hypothetical protein